MKQESLETAKGYFRRQIRFIGIMLNIVWWLFFFSTAAIIYFLWVGQTELIFISIALSFFFATNVVCLQIYNHQVSVAFQGLVIPGLLASTDADQLAREAP